jgi:pimeloyl-ACP methyl ester carboxylesterase
MTAVLVGRSYGGRIVMNLANTLGADQVHKIVRGRVTLCS